MRLENFRLESDGQLTKAIATVIWEDSDRPSKDIYFATTEPFAADLSANPHAFLLACCMPAVKRKRC